MTTKIKELLDKIIDGKELRRQFEVKGSDERGPSAMAAVANVCMARGDDYQTLDAALDLVWEKLNTGHWRSVNADWEVFNSSASPLHLCCNLPQPLNTQKNAPFHLNAHFNLQF